MQYKKGYKYNALVIRPVSRRTSLVWTLPLWTFSERCHWQKNELFTQLKRVWETKAHNPTQIITHTRPISHKSNGQWTLTLYNSDIRLCITVDVRRTSQFRCRIFTDLHTDCWQYLCEDSWFRRAIYIHSEKNKSPKSEDFVWNFI